MQGTKSLAKTTVLNLKNCTKLVQLVWNKKGDNPERQAYTSSTRAVRKKKKSEKICVGAIYQDSIPQAAHNTSHTECVLLL